MVRAHGLGERLIAIAGGGGVNLYNSMGNAWTADYLKINPKARVPALVTPRGILTETPAMLAFFAAHPMSEWDLRVQLNTDLEKMPIENASIAWPDDLSPHVPVATLRVPNQVAWSEARSAAVDDGMSFSPWHGLVAHQPLGVIMRVRRRAYEASAAHRAQLAACNASASRAPSSPSS